MLPRIITVRNNDLKRGKQLLKCLEDYDMITQGVSQLFSSYLYCIANLPSTVAKGREAPPWIL